MVLLNLLVVLDRHCVGLSALISLRPSLVELCGSAQCRRRFRFDCARSIAHPEDGKRTSMADLWVSYRTAVEEEISKFARQFRQPS